MSESGSSRFERMSPSLDVRGECDILYGYMRELQPDRHPAHEEFFALKFIHRVLGAGEAGDLKR